MGGVPTKQIDDRGRQNLRSENGISVDQILGRRSIRLSETLQAESKAELDRAGTKNA